MGGSGTSYWLLHGIAGALFLAGLLLAIWALFQDRPRGRQRCPRCWYDMAGVPGLTCPECGRDAGREKRLFRTRRRWRWAGVGLLVLMVGLTAGRYLAYQRAGFWAAVPRAVLIVMLPRLAHVQVGHGPFGDPIIESESLLGQAEGRLFDDDWQLARLWWPERRLLDVQARRLLMDDDAPDYIVGLAARALVLVRDDAVSAVPLDRAGPLIGAKCMLTYAQASTFYDVGASSVDHVREQQAIVFVRDDVGPHRLRIETDHIRWRNSVATRRVAWTDGDGNSWSRWHDVPESLLRGGSPETFLALPHSLLISGSFWSSAWSTGRFDYIGMDEIRGRQCFHVRTGNLVSVHEDIWIDAERFLVLQTRGPGGFSGDFNPQIDIEIHHSWFESAEPGSTLWLLDDCDPAQPVPAR